MIPTDLHTLTGTVQRNCHISDGLYARDYTLCIYLLKMREYYRWEKGYGFADRLPSEDLGRWLTEREELWQELEAVPFESLDIAGEAFDPFEADAVNAELVPEGYVYGGGIGGFSKPHFFLGRLHHAGTFEGHPILETGEEYARDITAPPAMTQGNTIFIRRESIRRMLWEKIEEWRFNPRENAMSRAMGAYDFEGDFEGSLARMMDSESEAVKLHEAGELNAGALLGPAWEHLLAGMGRSRAEFGLRAVRDHLADCTVTLPALIEHEAVPSLHFYMANFQGMRRELFPRLRESYDAWCGSGSLERLADTVESGARHWEDVARKALETAERREEEGELNRLLEEAML